MKKFCLIIEITVLLIFCMNGVQAFNDGMK
jgi:hypothetical protein